jgi:TIR domain
MFVSFALFESVDAAGRVESFLVFPTDAPHVVVDRLRDVHGMSTEHQVDLGPLRFYATEAGLKIRRLVGQYGRPVFARIEDRIRLDIEHRALPIAENTMGYYALLLPEEFCGDVHPSFKAGMHWLSDTRRLLVSGEILDHRGYLTKDVAIRVDLREGAEPDASVPRIKSTQVCADWGGGGPHHNGVRKFIRAANASLSSPAIGVFICHSHEDKPFARQLAVAIAGSGFKVWLDEAEIRVGESLIAKIEAGITDATHLVAVISRASVTSRWCQEELRMALSRQIQGKGIAVLPVVVDDCELPGFLQEKKYADFRQARNFDHSLGELTTALTG